MIANNDNDLVQVNTCTKCGETKPVSAFYVDNRRGGYRPECRHCSNQAGAKWRRENPDKHKSYNDAWYRDNATSKNAKAREWQKQHPDKVRKYQSDWRERNPDRAKEIHRKSDAKRRATAKGKLENNIKAGIHRGLTKGAKNGRRTFDLLGFTLQDLIRHLEKQFLPGMSWKNYGEWHVDHRIPLAAHNYETPDDIDFKRAWRLQNLQPLWAEDNKAKYAKLEKPFQPSLALAT